LQQIVNRLTGSSGAVISQNDYTYDGVGNRKTATEKAGSATTPVTSEAYGYDPLGNRSYKSDTSGATLGTQLYDAWGNKLAVTASGSIAQYGYTGREPDETGLIYYRARYYDPSIGRFTQRDPIGLAGGLTSTPMWVAIRLTIRIPPVCTLEILDLEGDHPNTR
ncbi:MAG TPA: RHS repeat-associated core domain-containing protein, partial [Gammaproteobacteria bacterium]|nr:RHS repeat-associated core domain-containing protein [Gammaproteobacteria bacterium]